MGERPGLRLCLQPGREALRPAPGRGLRRCEKRSDADPERMARPTADSMTPSANGVIARLRARLAARPDTEHEQALVRVAVGFVLGLYLLPEITRRPGEQHNLVWGLYSLVALALFVAVVIWPKASSVRRTIGA